MTRLAAFIHIVLLLFFRWVWFCCPWSHVRRHLQRCHSIARVSWPSIICTLSYGAKAYIMHAVSEFQNWWSVHSETYHVEPITNHLPPSSHHNRIVYKDSDVNYDLLNRTTCSSAFTPRLRAFQVAIVQFLVVIAMLVVLAICLVWSLLRSCM